MPTNSTNHTRTLMQGVDGPHISGLSRILAYRLSLVALKILAIVGKPDQRCALSVALTGVLWKSTCTCESTVGLLCVGKTLALSSAARIFSVTSQHCMRRLSTAPTNLLPGTWRSFDVVRADCSLGQITCDVHTPTCSRVRP